MRNISWLWIVGVLFFTSCIGENVKQSYWDSTTGTYTIPSLGINYTVHSDIENWAIADIDGSVPEIKFCGVDHLTNICVAIVEPDSKLKSVAELDTVRLKGILREIVCQTPTGQILRFDSDLERSCYCDSESWHFRADVSVGSQSDTVEITYLGYIFDCPNGRVAGIVSIVPPDVPDSVSLQTMCKYFDGVNLIK